MTGLFSPVATNMSPTMQWTYVTRRFEGFIENLQITAVQVSDGETKRSNICNALNSHYYNYASGSDNSILTGSWGKQLRVRPPRDVDILFVLPWSVYERFEQRTGNKQTQLLQEVKSVLAAKFSESDISGDGQAVVVRFASMPVEVVPAFRINDGTFLICDTPGGGSYLTTDPVSEIAELATSDSVNLAVTRRLIRMAKQWQRHCNVPIKSFMLERLAIQFLREWTYTRDYFWFDWLVRDFFAFIIQYANGWVSMPGTNRKIDLGNAWLSRANTAHTNAARACHYERANKNVLAGIDWQNIFGNMIPMFVQ